MKFIKDKSILFDESDLKKAILLMTNNPKESYKISIRNTYPCLCIGHDHHYVHRLLGNYYFDDINGFFIHHKNGIKTDNRKTNLELISNSKHTKLHHIGKDFRSDETIKNSILAMAKAKRRDDVKQEEVKKLKNDGWTYSMLCEHFKCGCSVISRCLH